jgi:hypothetical protein
MGGIPGRTGRAVARLARVAAGTSASAITIESRVPEEQRASSGGATRAAGPASSAAPCVAARATARPCVVRGQAVDAVAAGTSAGTGTTSPAVSAGAEQ